jgi:hypothetical protein
MSEWQSSVVTVAAESRKEIELKLEVAVSVCDIVLSSELQLEFWDRKSKGGSKWTEYRRTQEVSLRGSKVWREDFVCNICSDSSALRSVARRQLAETEHSSACEMVNWKVCNTAIVLYCMYLSVIQKECVTKVLINPIIQTRTTHFITHTTLHTQYKITNKTMVSCLLIYMLLGSR